MWIMAGDTGYQAVSQEQRGIYSRWLDQYGMIIVGTMAELAHCRFGKY
jgi:hypothetical protein